ncbi:MAG: acyl-CoA synthetase [Hydrocarboniphaga sp.]|uniref:fatty acyl-AMP ligase n=1 Tax=Hydrocarboniphaga sp. TaxID=2033016 RepID=UPI00260243AD|nr:fatty acyl-AMP ligase [Hydrocarboniphaga sp.]MDB5968149.1 acyl-CoA synthetase [Hydrocarboniphaga sp.]
MTDSTPAPGGPAPFAVRDFASLAAALEHAAQGSAGMNFYSGRGQLTEGLPYSRLRGQAEALALRLLAKGLVRGDRVALLAETDGDFARAFFACQIAGLVPAPLPLPAALGGRETYLEHVRRMTESIGAAAVLAPAAFESWIVEACADLPLRFVGTIAGLAAVEPAVGDLAAPAPDDLAYLQFSSGSTRFPHAIAVTHRAVVANIDAIVRFGLKIGPGDRCASWLPFYHDMGLVGFLLTPVCCAISVDYLATREFARRPLTWLQLISNYGGTLSFSPSFGFELCARRVENGGVPEGLDLSRWRAAGIGGDMVRPGPLQKFVEAFAASGFKAGALTPSYGMAEAALALSFSPLGRGLRMDTLDTDRLEREHLAVAPTIDTQRSRDFVRCGAILPGHEVEVRDDNGDPMPELGVGLLHVRGPSLFKEYFAQPEETARAIGTDGWLNTGDIGYLVDGEIVITGRAKDLIIVNGRNIRPQDLEWTAEGEVSSLRSGDVAAFAVDDGAGESVVVLIESRLTETAARAALCEEVSGVLRARHGIEVRVVPVPPRSLPQTSSGKLSRAKARALYLSGSFELAVAG